MFHKNKVKKYLKISAVGATVVLGIYLSNPKTIRDLAAARHAASTLPRPEATMIQKEALTADKRFMESEQNLLQKYPWYTAMPINNQYHVIVYDFNKEMFRVVLKIDKSSSKSLVDYYTNKALQELINHNIDIELFGGYYQTFENQ